MHKALPHVVHIDLSLNKDNLWKHILISYAILLLKWIDVVLRMFTYFYWKTTGKNADYENIVFAVRRYTKTEYREIEQGFSYIENYEAAASAKLCAASGCRQNSGRQSVQASLNSVH